MEKENEVVDTQEIDDLELDDIDDDSGVEEVASPQTPAQDANFADKRRKEEIAELKTQVQDANSLNERLINSLGAMGFSQDPDSLLEELTVQTDEKIAEEQGISIELARQHRIEIDEARSQVSNLETQLKELQQQQIETVVNNELSAVQSSRQEVKTVNDIPELYWKCREAGIPSDVAISVSFKEKPADMGAVGVDKEKSDRFSDEELDRLTLTDLDNDEILQKAMDSLKE